MVAAAKYRLLRKRLQNLEGDRSRRETALVLSVGNDIVEAVRQHLKNAGQGGLPVQQVHQPGSFSDDESEWWTFVDRLKIEVRHIREEGVTRVHLFIQAPVALAVFAGALLDNGPEVVVYHWFSGTYKPIGRVAHEIVKM